MNVRPPVLDRLRDATKARHAAVERASGLHEGCRDRYVWFVARQYGFVAPVEPRLAAVEGIAAVGLELARRARAARFEADLRFLGADPAKLPRCAALPDVGTPARALGALYVLEGSTLGGNFILKKLGPSLGITAAAGGSAMAPYGAATRDLWMGFAGALDRWVEHRPEDEAAVVAAAVETFDRLHDWFTEG
jgi:heme oxygenase (biliverdin-IX-beta and delta-forming)